MVADRPRPRACRQFRSSLLPIECMWHIQPLAAERQNEICEEKQSLFGFDVVRRAANVVEISLHCLMVHFSSFVIQKWLMLAHAGRLQFSVATRCNLRQFVAGTSWRDLPTQRGFTAPIRSP